MTKVLVRINETEAAINVQNIRLIRPPNKMLQAFKGDIFFCRTSPVSNRWPAGRVDRTG